MQRISAPEQTREPLRALFGGRLETAPDRRVVARRNQVVRHRTRIKNEIHSIPHALLAPRRPPMSLAAWVAPGCGDRRHSPFLLATGARQLFRSQSESEAVGVGVAHQGRISTAGRSRARSIWVEAAWADAETPAPRHAFFARVRAKRGRQIAAVALARKLDVPCWRVLTKEADDGLARLSLEQNCSSDKKSRRIKKLERILIAKVCQLLRKFALARPARGAKKIRDRELARGQAPQKGSKRGAASAYNVKSLRNREKQTEATAERLYQNMGRAWPPRRSKDAARGPLKTAGHAEAARRRLQPACRSSARARPRQRKICEPRERLSSSLIFILDMIGCAVLQICNTVREKHIIATNCACQPMGVSLAIWAKRCGSRELGHPRFP